LNSTSGAGLSDIPTKVLKHCQAVLSLF
jgi:hypothetical protein